MINLKKLLLSLMHMFSEKKKKSVFIAARHQGSDNMSPCIVATHYKIEFFSLSLGNVRDRWDMTVIFSENFSDLREKLSLKRD